MVGRWTAKPAKPGETIEGGQDTRSRLLPCHAKSERQVPVLRSQEPQVCRDPGSRDKLYLGNLELYLEWERMCPDPSR